MKKLFLALAILLFLAAFLAYFRWSSSIHQPHKFSHAQHVNQDLSCDSCHKQNELESLPPGSLCKICHPAMTVPQDAGWIRVYRTAPDIIFTHQQHSTVPCNVCHVDTTSAKRFVHETRFPMDFCMGCHAQQGARNDCKACHKYR